MEAEYLTVFRVGHEDGIRIGDRRHINHIHVTLGSFAPDALRPFELDYAGEPAFPLIRVEHVLHVGDLARYIKRVDKNIIR